MSDPQPDLDALRQRQQQDWQPIATAPKDGQWIWVRSERTGRLSVFRWDLDYRPEPMWFAGAGWWHNIERLFTHWKPMAQCADVDTLLACLDAQREELLEFADDLLDQAINDAETQAAERVGRMLTALLGTAPTG